MKQTYLTLLILPLLFIAAGQETLYAFEPGGGDSTYIYEARVNLRDQPSLDGKMAALALMGEEVEILEKTEKEQEIYGTTAFWYKIRYKEKVCYVWGGLISDGGRPLDFTPGKDSEKDHEAVLIKLKGGKCHIRLSKNNREGYTLTLYWNGTTFVGDNE